MILTGQRIFEEVQSKRITIDPFDKSHINPNSCNYHLGARLCYPNKAGGEYFSIDENGFQLNPGELVLGQTVEKIGSDHYVTSLIGRSSLGRLGLFVQIDADMSNVGGSHCWTLELTAVQPIILYPNMALGQVSFWEVAGEISMYTGVYHEHNLPVCCLRQELLR